MTISVIRYKKCVLNGIWIAKNTPQLKLKLENIVQQTIRSITSACSIMVIIPAFQLAGR